MIKAVFFDVDDTLLVHSTGSVPESARKALESLRQKGILVIVATGRHLAEFEYLPIRDLCFDGYITNNGQICLDREKRLLWGEALPAETATQLVQIFNEKEVPTILIGADRLYINFVNDTARQALAEVSSPAPPIAAYRGEELYQATIFLSPDEAPALSRRLPGAKITWWNPRGIDVVAQQGGKRAGIRHFLEFCHISPEETMAFGDGENDMEMLEYVGLGVAMGNAPEMVKAVADYVTLPAGEDGICHALRHFGLID